MPSRQNEIIAATSDLLIDLGRVSALVRGCLAFVPDYARNNGSKDESSHAKNAGVRHCWDSANGQDEVSSGWLRLATDIWILWWRGHTSSDAKGCNH